MQPDRLGRHDPRLAGADGRRLPAAVVFSTDARSISGRSLPRCSCSPPASPGLQVAANPLAAELGPPQRSHFRLNFAQAFNSLGVVLGVHFGSLVMLGDLVAAGRGRRRVDRSQRAARSSRRSIAPSDHGRAACASCCILFGMLRKFLSSVAPDHCVRAPSGMFEALRSRWAVFGAVAIGLYVGAEVSIGSIMINFLNQPQVLGLPFEDAGAYLANFYWGGALCGRIVGTLLLTRSAPTACSRACGIIAARSVPDGPGRQRPGRRLCRACHRLLQFDHVPDDLHASRSSVRAYRRARPRACCALAIFGGALLPLAVGAIADRFGLGAAFAVPLLGLCVHRPVRGCRARSADAGRMLLPAQGSPIP